MEFNLKKNLYYMILEYIIKFIVSFFISIRVATVLGVERYGELNYLLSLIIIIVTLSNFGMEGLLVAKLSTLESKNEKKKFIKTSIFIQIIVYILILSIIFLYNIIVKNLISYNLLILLLGYFFSIFKNLKYYLIAQGDSYINSKVELVILLTASTLKIIFILLKGDLNDYIKILSIIEIFSGVGYIILYNIKYKDNQKKKIQLEKESVFSLIQESIPLFISAISVNLYMRIDQIMLKEMLDNYELGIYSAAIRLTEVWYIIPGLLLPILIPKVAYLRNRNTKKYEENIQKIISILLLISIIIFIFYQIFSKLLIMVTLGNEFNKAIGILKIYSCLIVIIFLGSFRGKWMILEGKQKYLAIIGSIGLVLNIILNYILIPIYKVQGAVIASIVSQLLTNHLLLFLFRDTKKFFFIQQSAIFKVFKIKDNLIVIKEKEKS